MQKDQFILIYWKQFKLIEKRIIELSDYVAIDKKNFPTFSNQFTSLFLEICSEVDSVADELCAVLGYDEKERYGITNKVSIILDKYNNMKSWTCVTRFPYRTIHLVPFVKFENNNSADWWKDYNLVKHKRTDYTEAGQYNYELANLKNVMNAAAALYLLIIKTKTEIFPDMSEELNSQIFEIHTI